MVVEATTFQLLYVLITNPEGSPSRGLFVTLEPLDYASSDRTVELCGEHDFIRTPMAVVYPGVKAMYIAELEIAIADPYQSVYLHRREPTCTPELLATLRDGLMRSPFVAPKYKTYCQQNC